ncbi:MAG: hypothetical protein H6739_39980 [Alphaproteobacteria bacterium]|nr:hypothetical protein [Alphaproteobacteria bacterium]
MSWMFLSALVSLSGVVEAAPDCTPCAGTIVYSGGSCFCYVKLDPIDPPTLELLPEDDPSAPPWVGWQIGLSYDGFETCNPDDEVIGYTEISDGWVQVRGELDVLDYWAHLNE